MKKIKQIFTMTIWPFFHLGQNVFLDILSSWALCLLGILTPWAFCHTWNKCNTGILTLGIMSHLGILSSWAFHHTKRIEQKNPRIGSSYVCRKNNGFCCLYFFEICICQKISLLKLYNFFQKSECNENNSKTSLKVVTKSFCNTSSEDTEKFIHADASTKFCGITKVVIKMIIKHTFI